MTNHKKYFTTGDVGRYCEVDVNTVKSWIRGERLEAFKTPSGHFRIPKKSFQAFVKKQGFNYDPLFFGEDPDSPDILVIDDDLNHRKLMEIILGEAYGEIIVDTASNGFDGYMQIQKQKPKIILLDIMMPGISGIEFLKILKSNENFKDIDTIVISAFLDQKMKTELIDLGVSQMLDKPVDKALLKKHIDKILAKYLIKNAHKSM